MTQFAIENYWLKVGIILKTSANITDFFCLIFFNWIVLIIPDQNLTLPLDQNMLILLISNVSNSNIGTFWHRKSRRKTWCSLKSLLILSIFLLWLFGLKLCQYPRYTYYCIFIWDVFCLKHILQQILMCFLYDPQAFRLLTLMYLTSWGKLLGS